MNRLNKLLLSFVLPILCLLISVSNAFEFDTELIVTETAIKTDIDYDTDFNTEYTFREIYTAFYQNYSSSTGILSVDDNLNNLVNEIYLSGYYVLFLRHSTSLGIVEIVLFPTSNDVGRLGTGFRITYSPGDLIYSMRGSSSLAEVKLWSGNGDCTLCPSITTTVNVPIYCSKNIKWLTDAGDSYCYYDESKGYFYETPFNAPSGPDEPDTPPLPTNTEIAQAVQAFYNSDYYKTNKDFKEFFVLYNSLKGIYSFIGHNSVGEIANHFEYGSTLSQHIYSDDYPSNTYGLSYWNFNLETLGSQISNVFNNYYWLYSSYDNGESITYDGKGYVSDLLEVNFDSRYSTIVYSSTNYLCRVYDYENDEETNEQATIPGNQYTYDETLEPTTNEYNPIKDYIPVNPSQSILGDVDFDEINKVFEENKDILNIENASWLFSANNQLINYFIGFLSFLIVLIIISRLLGG